MSDRTPKWNKDRLIHCPFPKHKGKPWTTIIEEDYDYVYWLVSGEGPDMEDELYDLLTEYLEDT